MSANNSSALLKKMLGIAASSTEEMQLPKDGSSAKTMDSGEKKKVLRSHMPPPAGDIIFSEKLGKSKNNDKKEKSYSPSKIKDATAFISEKSNKIKENYAWSAFQSSPDPSTLPDIRGLFSSLRVGEHKHDVREESSIVKEEKAAVLFSIKKNEKMELLFQQKKEYEEIIPTAAPNIKNRHDHDRTFLHQVRQEKH